MKDWTIRDIEKLTQGQLESFAEMTHDVIKGHDVYFGEFGRFGYSAIVCADGAHLKYANEYQLHYPESRYPDRGSLHKRFVEVLNGKLFTEDELRETSESFDELTRKRYYLQNIYDDKRENQSIFGDAAEWYEREKAEGRKLPFSPVGLGYYHWYDQWFVDHMNELKTALEAANNPLRDYEHAKAAFKYEMYNHEYPINWQGDWDVINCFCKVEYDGYGGEIEQTGWSDEIKRAYRDAAHEVTMNGDW